MAVMRRLNKQQPRTEGDLDRPLRRADRFRALRDSGILPPKTLRAKERFRTAAALYVHLTSGKGPIFTPEHYERIEDTPPSQRPVPVSEDSITWAPVDQITAVGLVRRAFGLNSDEATLTYLKRARKLTCAEGRPRFKLPNERSLIRR